MEIVHTSFNRGHRLFSHQFASHNPFLNQKHATECNVTLTTKKLVISWFIYPSNGKRNNNIF